MIQSNIVPECYVDTKVAEIVGQAKKYNHQHGCGDVANEFRGRLNNIAALGIIDEDANKGPSAEYFTDFSVVKQENNLILKKHHQKQHYLILVCPEIEKWLMETAQNVNISPLDYGLPHQLKGFIKITKIKDIDRNEDFKRFIKHLIRENAPGIITLKKWIELFNINQFHTLDN